MYIEHIIHKCDNARLNTQSYQGCTQTQHNVITNSLIGSSQSNIHVNHVLSSTKIHPPPKKKSKAKKQNKKKNKKKMSKRQKKTLSSNSIRYTCS